VLLVLLVPLLVLLVLLLLLQLLQFFLINFFSLSFFFDHERWLIVPVSHSHFLFSLLFFSLVRGYRTSILRNTDYLNLTQCENLDGM